MGKGKQEAVKPKDEVKQEEQTAYGVTIGMGVYKPIPRFRSNCKNC